MKKFILKAAQLGIASAPAFCISNNEILESAAPFDREIELGLLNHAYEGLKLQLVAAAKNADLSTRPLIEAEIMLLEDSLFIGSALKMIREKGISASRAISEVGASLSQNFLNNSSEYMKARADDVRGLADDILQLLRGEKRDELKRPSIIVARELSPTYFSCLERALIKGMVTEKGSAISHLAILAGNYGIPYIYGCEEALSEIKSGDCLIIDGENLIINPDSQMLEKVTLQANQFLDSSKAKLHLTKEYPVKIYANCASLSDIEEARAQNADGIGLFRTEFLFLEDGDAPSEEKQFEIYREAAKIMGEKELCIRTMDIGSDKTPKWMDIPHEKNPALGCRGIRFSLENLQLFKNQLRAILRAASFGNVKLLLPMIASTWEIEKTREILRNCEEELVAEGTLFKVPDLGIMIETPAAVMMAPELAASADFFSIGTNDLTQYTLAIDREGEGLDKYYDPSHEAIFRMIRLVCQAAKNQGIPVTVCGELAGISTEAERLINIGVDALSVATAKLHLLK
ncbi:MAG: phosphoenolpyruvate--protein phosphotransferase [Lachnospiraceae bacterium]|nr:phosphoenolpyruvate--protein phosphotransferase [Lachnospiraceae bacterium]